MIAQTKPKSRRLSRIEVESLRMAILKRLSKDEVDEILSRYWCYGVMARFLMDECNKLKPGRGLEIDGDIVNVDTLRHQISTLKKRKLIPPGIYYATKRVEGKWQSRIAYVLYTDKNPRKNPFFSYSNLPSYIRWYKIQKTKRLMARLKKAEMESTNIGETQEPKEAIQNEG